MDIWFTSLWTLCTVFVIYFYSLWISIDYYCIIIYAINFCYYWILLISVHYVSNYYFKLFYYVFNIILVEVRASVLITCTCFKWNLEPAHLPCYLVLIQAETTGLLVYICHNSKGCKFNLPPNWYLALIFTILTRTCKVMYDILCRYKIDHLH